MESKINEHLTAAKEACEEDANDLTAKYSEAIAPSDKPIAETLDDMLGKKDSPEAVGLVDNTSPKNASSNLGK